MSTKYTIICIVSAAVIGAACGYYALPSKIEIHTVIQKDTEKQNNIDTKITRTKKPDGTVITEITKEDKSTTQTQVHKDSTKVTEYSHDTLTIRALMAGDIHSGTISYGLGVDKKVLGPFSIGVFGLSSGVLGGSVGISF